MGVRQSGADPSPSTTARRWRGRPGGSPEWMLIPTMFGPRAWYLEMARLTMRGLTRSRRAGMRLARTCRPIVPTRSMAVSAITLVAWPTDDPRLTAGLDGIPTWWRGLLVCALGRGVAGRLPRAGAGGQERPRDAPPGRARADPRSRSRPRTSRPSTTASPGCRCTTGRPGPTQPGTSPGFCRRGVSTPTTPSNYGPPRPRWAARRSCAADRWVAPATRSSPSSVRSPRTSRSGRSIGPMTRAHRGLPGVPDPDLHPGSPTEGSVRRQARRADDNNNRTVRFFSPE
jgi:hypothetical protein